MTAKKMIFVVLLLAACLLTSGPGAAGPSSDEVTRARLLLSRATYGARPGDLDAVLAQGTKAWLEEQLEPERIDDSAVVTSLGKLDNLQLSTTELMRKYPQPSRAEREAMLKARSSGERMAPARDGARVVLRELWQAKLYRAVHSERQLQEVMTDFWFNHFNVYTRKNRNTLLSIAVLRTRRDTASRVRSLRGPARGDGRASGNAVLSRQLGEYERGLRPARSAARPAREPRWPRPSRYA